MDTTTATKDNCTLCNEVDHLADTRFGMACRACRQEIRRMDTGFNPTSGWMTLTPRSPR